MFDWHHILTNADGSRGVGFQQQLSVCASVCLSVVPRDISKTAAARITKLDIEMFHYESWKPIYCGVKRAKVKTTRHKNSTGVDFCSLVITSFYS